MKFPEQWANQIIAAKSREEIIKLVDDIRLEAFAFGMENAAIMVECQSVHSDFSLQWPDGDKLMAEKIRASINREPS